MSIQAIPFLANDFQLLLTCKIHVPEQVAIFAADLEFKLKDETHITIIGRSLAKVVRNCEGAKKYVTRFLGYHPTWDFSHTDAWYMVKKDYPETGVRESIIMMVTVDQAKEFYDGLNAYKLNVPVVPLHITVFTKHSDAGIGLPNTSDLLQYGRPVPIVDSR